MTADVFYHIQRANDLFQHGYKFAPLQDFHAQATSAMTVNLLRALINEWLMNGAIDAAILIY